MPGPLGCNPYDTLSLPLDELATQQLQPVQLEAVDLGFRAAYQASSITPYPRPLAQSWVEIANSSQALQGGAVPPMLQQAALVSCIRDPVLLQEVGRTGVIPAPAKSSRAAVGAVMFDALLALLEKRRCVLQDQKELDNSDKPNEAAIEDEGSSCMASWRSQCANTILRLRLSEKQLLTRWLRKLSLEWGLMGDRVRMARLGTLTQSCELCGQFRAKVCSECGQGWYCCANHQRILQRPHQLFCKSANTST